MAEDHSIVQKITRRIRQVNSNQQRQLVALGSETEGKPLDVFISYSRSDQEFAVQLDDELRDNGFTTWFDKNDVFPAGKFWEDIHPGIEEAGAFIFILSLASLQSEACTQELNYAHDLEKKIIWVNLSSRADISFIKESLKERDWITDSDWIDADPFNSMLIKVREAILNDQDEWRQSGQWLRMATRWNNDRKRNSGLLLHGKELKKAEQWEKRADKLRRVGIDRRPRPLPIHIQFIRASRSAFNRFLVITLVVSPIRF